MLKTYLKSIHPLLFYLQTLRIKKSVVKLFSYSLVLLVTICSIGSISVYIYLLRDLPSINSLTNKPLPLTTHIRDRNGQILYKVYENENRSLIKLTDLPPHLKQAVLAIEDTNFYNHSGFSTKGIARALFVNLRSFITDCKLKTENCEFTAVQGGSTITQQLVKTSLLTPERSIKRKAQEIILSLQTERHYSKDEILEMYLNRIGFGGATYGIEEASHTYFGIPASDLDLAQSALLAGLPAAPSTYSPFGTHPDLAKKRQQEVLSRMSQTGFISWTAAEKASAEKLTFKNPANNVIAPHFVMYIKELLSKKYGAAAVEQGGLDITTTLDINVQEMAEKIVRQEIAKVSYLNITNGAALVTNPSTGEILAMVGSRDYFDLEKDGNVNVVLASRQPGSSIKPLNYALALQNGLTPATVIEDSPVVYKITGQPDYRPTNYDNRYHGRVTLRTALASSYNIPAVKILEKNGVKNFIEFASRLGISTWTNPDNYGLSLTLGGGEVTMLDLATSYGVFANSGTKITINPILSIKDSSGKHIEDRSVSSHAVLDPRIAYQITDILLDNFARTPTFGPNSQLYIPGRQVAVKTGTTNNLRDNWTIGYTPNRLVAVWVGNNDNKPMSYVASGVTGASPIWRKIMDQLILTTPTANFSVPDGLVKLETCYKHSELFLTGTQPPPCITPTPIRIAIFPRVQI